MYPTNGIGARRKAILRSTTLLAGVAGMVLAPTLASAQTSTAETIVVTGFRQSLEQSTKAKRESNNFSDSIFAEDIGKFPDTNIAESFNRVPGVTITREITGEGLNISIRGLGTNFTKILLNGSQTAVASTGRTDAQNTNREVDLDMFPTELFTQLTVNKSPLASMVEGGAAGTVNMRQARPFDNPGEHVTWGFQRTDTRANKNGWRGSAIASFTNGDWGGLIGVAGVHNPVRVTGFETIGWTNPNLITTGANPQCINPADNCNATGGGNWTIPNTAPANTGLPGVVAGTIIDKAFLLARNPGLTIQQIDSMLIPRLGRPSDEYGDKDRLNSIASIEYRPTDTFHAYFDAIWGRRKNDLERIDMNWVGRNGAVIPVNVTVDRNNVVTSGTFANAQFFLEYRPFIEDVEFFSLNPGATWEITDNFKADLQVNWSRSHFHRESPTVLPITLASSGLTVTYTNNGQVPSIASNVDLNNPANFQWVGGRVNIQDERRVTFTKGAHADFTWGGDIFNFKFGVAYDDVYRRIRAFDNSQFWQNAVCGGNPNVQLPGPNTQPPCQGLAAGAITPGVGGYPSYPALGTGYSTGFPALVYGGSLITNAALVSYLKPGPSGFVTLDWSRFKRDTNYDAFHRAAGEAGSSNTGASGGLVEEKTWGYYGEFNGTTHIQDHRLRYNAGLRYVKTEQEIGGIVSVSDPRNNTDPDGPGPLPASCPGGGANLRDGSCYPNILNFVRTKANYKKWLPAVNLVFDASDNVVMRAAVSRSMTRANPNSMLPGVNFSSPSADTGSIGNPGLQPFISENLDFGAEYYTGAEGYFGVAAFRKTLTGFTVNQNTTVPFSFLAAYGITYTNLTPTQQGAIDARCGVGNSTSPSCTIVLTQQVNASGKLYVNGLETNWVQPLDFLVGDFIKGLGFIANYTIIDQRGVGAAPAVATGVAPYTWNLTGYYENHGLMARLSYVFNKGSITSGTNQNGIPAAALFSDDYHQYDLSMSYDLGHIFTKWGSAPEITFDVINLTEEKQRAFFQFPNATFTLYDPGRTVMFGLRGRF